MDTATRSKWRYICALPVAVLTITAIPKIIGMEFIVSNMEVTGMGHMTA